MRPIEIHIENEAIQLKSTVKYLGVYIDQKLNFNAHVRYITDKAKKISHNLNRIMPRTHGADEGKRQLLASVAWSIVVTDSRLGIRETGCFSL